MRRRKKRCAKRAKVIPERSRNANAAVLTTAPVEEDLVKVVVDVVDEVVVEAVGVAALTTVAVVLVVVVVVVDVHVTVVGEIGVELATA